MIQYKDLLLKDFCPRLPYGIKVKVTTYETAYDASVIAVFDNGIVYVESTESVDAVDITEIKPYLFPLSSMTEEQKEELLALELEAINDGIDHVQVTAIEIDFYNKHHLDWRGLILIGLAVDATELNIY